MLEKPSRPLWILAVVAAVFMLGTDAQEAEVDDGVDMYFRDVDLSAASPQHLETYIDVEPGESMLLERAYPGAPPQISHTVEDMLPVKGNDNECIECHHPDNVTGEEDAPIPESHFKYPVMAKGKKNEPMISKVGGYKKGDDVWGARFNCTMCHTPQATNVKTPRSTFIREKEESK